MSHPLQSRTSLRIRELFLVTQEQSESEAASLLDAIQSHSGDASNWSVIEELIERKLGTRLQWLSQSAKDSAAKLRADKIAGYSAYLEKSRNPLERKW